MATSGLKLDSNEGDSDFDEEDTSEPVDSAYRFPGKCIWNADFTESVYDDGVLRIIEMGDNSSNSPRLTQFCAVTACLVLLCFNGMMQFFVIQRITTIVTVQKHDKRDQLFYAPPEFNDGACYKRVPGVLPDFLPTTTAPDWPAQARQKWYESFDLSRHDEQTESLVWDCGPLLPTLLSNVSWLDTDNDGDWCLSENPEGQAQPWSDKLAKAGNLSRTWHKLMGEIKESKSQYQQIHRGTGIDIQNWTKSYTCIPMSWMRAEQPVLALCSNVDPMLCGNLEHRGILKKFITHPPGLDANDRIALCRVHAKRCDTLFGELFRSYTLFAANVCGDMQSEWKVSAQIIANLYSRAAAYDPLASLDSGSAITSAYYLFLFVVLVIWVLTVLAEMRLVFRWWVAIVLMAQSNGPSLVKGTYAYAGGEVKEDYINVESISVIKKVLICVLVLIPRTVVAFWLGWVGIQFLIVADNYEEIILNAVALAFVSEIDEMLFAALAGWDRKQDIASAQPLEALHPCRPACIECFKNTPRSLFMLAGILVAVFTTMLSALFSDFGKDDVSEAATCLCQAEGTKCLAAKIFGALAFTPEDIPEHRLVNPHVHIDF